MIRILAKYFSTVGTNTSIHQHHLATHFPFRAALSVRKFSRYKPQYVVPLFPTTGPGSSLGATETDLIIFL